MQSLTSDYLAALRYDGLQVATLRALGEYQGKQGLYAAQSPEILADYARSPSSNPPSPRIALRASS